MIIITVNITMIIMINIMIIVTHISLLLVSQARIFWTMTDPRVRATCIFVWTS